MKAELLIRPGFNDHEAIANALAPGPRSVDHGAPPIDRLVVDAHIAVRRPQFADAAEKSGIPLVIDPLTFLGQGDLDKDDPWLRVPFSASASDPLTPVDRLVDEVLSFELNQRATMVIPPYFYSTGPDDPAARRNLEILAATRRWLNAQSIELPVVPVLCGQLHSLSTEEGWERGVQPFLRHCSDMNVQFIAMCVSPVGQGEEGVGKLASVFNLSRRIQQSFDVVGWRQGIYGPALVAAGIRGYETGIATREQCNIRSSITSRKKRPMDQEKKQSGGPSSGVLLEIWGRSLRNAVADVLMQDDSLKARLMCMDETCCPEGHESTLSDLRGHALRTRARQLHALASQPRRWQLYHVERTAFDGVTIAKEANKLLELSDLKERIRTKGLSSLVEVARRLREHDSAQDVA